MSKINDYNSWVYSLSKFKFILLLILTSILETFALAVLPAIIDNNYDNIIIKSIVILIIISTLNFIVHYWKMKLFQYSEKAVIIMVLERLKRNLRKRI